MASCVVGIALLLPLVLMPRSIPPSAAWSAFALACVCGALAAWARKRLRHLETVLEVSRFSITEVGPTSRRTLRWDGPLVLIARPRWRRLELRVPGARDYIALDYDRVGIDRAVGLVIEYGGFEELRPTGARPT